MKSSILVEFWCTTTIKHKYKYTNTICPGGGLVQQCRDQPQRRLEEVHGHRHCEFDLAMIDIEVVSECRDIGHLHLL